MHRLCVRTALASLACALILNLPALAQGGGNRRGSSGEQTAPQPAAQSREAQPGTPPSGAPPPQNTSARPSAPERGGNQPTATPDQFYDFDPNAGQLRAGEKFNGPPVETHQKITWRGQSLSYTATAGFLPLPNATTGLPEAHVFFTSYVKDSESAESHRPLIFFFGGAPGVSAAWQEFGGFGPKKMFKDSSWTDNPHTILGQADLVFVNPVGTGFSVPAQANRGSIFWNTQGDVGSLGAFVRLYIARNSREASPIFLAGEDSGTARVAGLAGYLTDHAISVHGIILLSLANAPDALAGDTQYITLLPSLTLTSWYHHKLGPELNGLGEEQIVAQARQFASREYLHALYRGDRMNADERAKVIADLSGMTGLSKQVVLNNNLRITLDRYNAELMRDDHRVLSRSDSRVMGFQPPPAGFGFGGGGRALAAAPAPVDFNMSAITGPFAAAYQSYLRHELNFSADKDAIFYWNGRGIGAFTSTATDETAISSAFIRNPKMHLFVSVSYFDLGTPFYATEYTLAHLSVSPEVRAHNITVSHQSAGEMAYLDSKASLKLENDLAGFLEEAMK